MGILDRSVKWLTACLALLLAVGAGLFPGSGRAASGQAAPRHGVIAVIVSTRSAITDLPQALVRRVFLGETTQVNGVRLLPFNHGPGEALRVHFDQLLLGFDEAATGRYWVDRRIRGQGLPPRILPNMAIARAAVARLPQAISYVWASDLDRNVRAIKLDGVAYDAPAYPLKY